MSFILHGKPRREERNVRTSNDSLRVPRRWSLTPGSDRSLAVLLPGRSSLDNNRRRARTIARLRPRRADRRRSINRRSAAILVNESVKRPLIVNYAGAGIYARPRIGGWPVLNDGDERGRVIIRISAQCTARCPGVAGHTYLRGLYINCSNK